MITNKKTTELMVNPYNPRHNPVLDEITAINLLIEESPADFFELINSINDQGFFQQKIVSLIKKDDQLVIIDGNRRISAIKCFLNPNIISNKNLRDKVQKIKSNKISEDMEIPCIVYDNIKEVAPYIFSEHTEGGSTKKWTQVNQYQFIIQYGNEKDVPEIFMLYYNNLDKKDLLKIENFSTIERVVRVDELRILKNLQKEKLILVLKRFVNDTNKGGGYTSRNLNTSEQCSEYFNNVINEICTTSIPLNQIKKENESKTIVNVVNSETKRSVKNNVKRNVVQTTAKEAFKSLKYTGINNKNKMANSVIAIIKEVKGLYKDYDKFPLATTILIRTLFELSLKYWLSEKIPKSYENLCNESKQKDPQLSKIIEFVKKYTTGNILFNIDIDALFKQYFSTSEKTLKDRMDILVHRPWDIGLNGYQFKLYEEDAIYKIIEFIVNN